MRKPHEIAHGEKLDEVRRELANRRSVYAQMVFKGIMSQSEADQRIETMISIVADYQAQTPTQQSEAA